MQGATTFSTVRPSLPRPCRPRVCRVRALTARDQAQKSSEAARPKIITQIAQSAGLFAAAFLLTASSVSADARDFELSAGERKLEQGLEDTIKSRGGALPSVPDSSPGYEKLKGSRVGPSAKEIRDTQEIGKASPPPPKRNLTETPAPELESPFRKLFGGLFNRPRSEAARTAATSPTPTGNNPITPPSPGQITEGAMEAAGSIAESTPSPADIKSQAKDAAGTIADNTPSTEGVKSQVEQAAGTVAASTPSPQDIKSQAKDVAGSVAESAENVPSTEGVKAQAKEAVSTVAESSPTPATPVAGGPVQDAGIASSDVQGVEAVTENAVSQGPDAVPDLPQSGTALSTATQGEDQVPGVAGPKPDESVTDSKGIPNDPMKVTTDSEMPNDPLNISSQSSVPQPLDTIADASMAAEDTSNPLLAKLRGAVESVAPSAADTAKKAEPLKKGIEAGEKNLEQQSPLESTPLEQVTKGQTQASKGKDAATQ